MAVLKESEPGLPGAEHCRKHDIDSARYYNWISKYSGVEVSELRRSRELGPENAGLECMYADLKLETAVIEDVPDRHS